MKIEREGHPPRLLVWNPLQHGEKTLNGQKYADIFPEYVLHALRHGYDVTVIPWTAGMSTTLQ